MLRKIFHSDRGKGSSKGSVYSVERNSECFRAAKTCEKKRMKAKTGYETDFSREGLFPSVHNTQREKVFHGLELEMYKFANTGLFKKIASLTAPDRGIVYKSGRLPCLGKKKWKVCQFVIEENSDEDNDEDGIEIRSENVTPGPRGRATGLLGVQSSFVQI